MLSNPKEILFTHTRCDTPTPTSQAKDLAELWLLNFNQYVGYDTTTGPETYSESAAFLLPLPEIAARLPVGSSNK